MNYLLFGDESERRFKLLLSRTRITSGPMGSNSSYGNIAHYSVDLYSHISYLYIFWLRKTNDH